MKKIIATSLGICLIISFVLLSDKQAEAVPTIVYSSTADGYADSDAVTWSNAVNGLGGLSSNSSLSYLNTAFYVEEYGGGYLISRSFFYFDLSSLAGTISSASINLYGYAGGNSNVSCQLGTQADILVDEDFLSISGSEYGHTASWSTAGYNTITFNAQGIADAQAQIGSGIFKVVCREYEHDYLNSAPGEDTSFVNGVYYSNNTGTDKDPYLEITFGAAPATASPVTNNGGTIKLNGSNLINK